MNEPGQNFASNQAAAAKAIGVSRATFIELARDPEFPKKTADGYDIEACRAFTEKYGRGQYRKGSGGESTAIDGVTLTEARIRLVLEQAENERIEKERQLVEQAKELQQIVAFDDVRTDFSKVIATIIETVDAAATAVDRNLPETLPTEEAWLEIRARQLGIVEKLPRDIGAAISDLW